MHPRIRIATAALSALTLAGGFPVSAETHAETGSGMMEMMDTGLMMPQMDAARGRVLFAEKGCVVCHSVNGVGGEDAPMLNAEFMDSPMNPFEFAARMWRGAEAMVELQREELGEVIDLTGDELADIIAFVHDPAEQTKLSRDDLSPEILEMMEHDDSDGHHDE